ncbi:hypothetical protein FKM82_016251 [Ascaphus truei]
MGRTGCCLVIGVSGKTTTPVSLPARGSTVAHRVGRWEVEVLLRLWCGTGMSFKRDGDDSCQLNVLKKRRVADLLASYIPEDEALLLKNGRCANQR